VIFIDVRSFADSSMLKDVNEIQKSTEHYNAW